MFWFPSTMSILNPFDLYSNLFTTYIYNISKSNHALQVLMLVILNGQYWYFPLNFIIKSFCWSLYCKSFWFRIIVNETFFPEINKWICSAISFGLKVLKYSELNSFVSLKNLHHKCAVSKIQTFECTLQHFQFFYFCTWN